MPAAGKLSVTPVSGAGSGEGMGDVGSAAVACPPRGAGHSALRPVSGRTQPPAGPREGELGTDDFVPQITV